MADLKGTRWGWSRPVWFCRRKNPTEMSVSFFLKSVDPEGLSVSPSHGGFACSSVREGRPGRCCPHEMHRVPVPSSHSSSLSPHPFPCSLVPLPIPTSSSIPTSPRRSAALPVPVFYGLCGCNLWVIHLAALVLFYCHSVQNCKN